MKREDLVDYDTFKQVYSFEEEDLTEEDIQKAYRNLLESDDFEIIAHMIGIISGQSEEQIEKNLEEVRKK